MTEPDHVSAESAGAPAAPTASRPPGWVLVVVAVGVVALALVSFVVGRQTAPAASGMEQPSVVDVGFSRDMLVHHQQAVLMSELVRDRGEDAELRSIAVDMVLTQQNQVGQMQGWLAVWGEPFASAEPHMAWMGGHAHEGPDGLMPGMATREQLTSLEDASGVEAERIFLELMIPHHRSGVEMAEYAVEHASVGAVRDLAGSMVRSQAVEIETLQKFLDERTP